MKRGVPFVATLLIGILVLAVFGRTGGSFQTAVIVTVGVMAIYLGWILWSQRTTHAYDRYADSFYYLGFMLTLSALLVALLGGASGEHAADLAGVLNKFGLGLVTTLVGLAGRIALNEFASGIEETADDALVQVRHSAERLAVELSLASRGIQDANAEMAKAIARQQAESARAIQQSVALVVEEMRLLQQSLSGAKQAMTTTAAQLATELSSAVNKAIADLIESAKESAKASIGAVESANRGIAESVSGIGAALATTVGKINSAAQAVVKNAEEATNGLSQAVTRINKQIEKLSVPPELLRDVFANALTQASKEFADFQTGIRAATDETSRLVTGLESTKRRVAEILAHGAAASDFGPLAEQIQSKARAFSAAVDAMAVASSRLSSSVGDAAKGLSESASQIRDQSSKDLEGIRRMRAQLEAELQQSADAMKRVHQSLTESARFITERLGP